MDISMLSTIFPYGCYSLQEFRFHSALLLASSNHQSCACQQTVYWLCPGKKWRAECFLNFLRAELLCDHHDDWERCRSYQALWIWYFYADSLHCTVIQEWFVGLARLESPAFLRFMWRNNTANNTKPKTCLKQPQITPEYTQDTKDKPMLS